jgi:hypothetical protein
MEENLEKIIIDLPNHWATGGEGLWSTPLGNDLYRIENVPFFAYGLNFHDIVRAIPNNPDENPYILEVVEPSGHKTLRVIFETEDNDLQVKLLGTLSKFGATYERANAINVAIDISKSGDYNATYDQLEIYIDQGHLSFETCEPRVEGSFDDAPDQE